MRHQWTENDRRMLADLGVTETARRLGLSPNAVGKAARRFGISKPIPRHYWSEQDLASLAHLGPMVTAERLGVSLQSAVLAAIRHGIREPETPRSRSAGVRCAYCDVAFCAIGLAWNLRRTCSDECSAAYRIVSNQEDSARRSAPRPKGRLCVECGKRFVQSRFVTTCSEKCRRQRTGRRNKSSMAKRRFGLSLQKLDEALKKKILNNT